MHEEVAARLGGEPGRARLDFGHGRRDFCAATYPALKMAIRFRPSKPWRNWRELWKCPFTNSFTMAKNLPNSQIS